MVVKRPWSRSTLAIVGLIGLAILINRQPALLDNPLAAAVAQVIALPAQTVQEARRYLQKYDLALECEHTTGPPHQRIVEFIGERGHDLLIIGAYGHSRIIEMVLGSTTEYVLRNSPCPVFLAR